MDGAFLACLNQNISWEKFKTRSGNGDPVYFAAVPIKGYVEIVSRIIRTVSGEERTTIATIYFDASASGGMSLQDVLTVPEIGRLPITGISPVFDEYGNLHHREVFI
jgi:hypothetical protein